MALKKSSDRFGVFEQKDYLHIDKSMTYFLNNKHWMKYAEHKVEKLMIGSGIVGATNKNLVARRMKQAGMRWRPEGCQAILTLRPLVLSDRFESACKILRKEG